MTTAQKPARRRPQPVPATPRPIQADIRLRFPNELRIQAARWVYKVLKDADDLEAQINALATEGWDVHTFTGAAVLMRRDALGAEYDAGDRAALLKEIIAAMPPRRRPGR